MSIWIRRFVVSKMQLISSKRAVVNIMRLRKKRKDKKAKERKRRIISQHAQRPFS
jgi:hypothetical protein